ncbi:hypothetical protein Spb1_27020 [Planctopirus ephydatiae]|uniref:AAA+ ATPase domain-containing protein n=1 Tax=Planctopirus ephydatiae TaxID=2528019 RepID=A0A518GQ66_9PLAN|nr:AAA family ATPase [Planctopirus ephydatiae]QDV30768.1 hypothetical protein Spb1_27020 [Planctopirus ephydatiae]
MSDSTGSQLPPGSLPPSRIEAHHSKDDAIKDLFGVPSRPVVRTATAPQFIANDDELEESEGMPLPSAGRQRSQNPAVIVPAPRVPTNLKETGLGLGAMAEFVLKELYIHGNMFGADIARQLRLPFPILDEALRFLKDQRCVEVSQGDLLGRVSYRFSLTDMGRVRARECFESCRYAGPAPVTLEQYVEQCRRQAVSGVYCHPQTIMQAFQGMVLKPGLLDEIGPAVCSGRSIFVYGPPGNGKTMIAKGLGRYLNLYCGEIYVPYAIQTENSIITVFDPILHKTTDDAEQPTTGNPAQTTSAGYNTSSGSLVVGNGVADPRWRRIRRPVVITGGELTLDMLELQYSKVSQFYAAPLHIKANGGVFLIDDFGRQLVSPRDLLNRWILPLEERIDYLTLATGRKFSVPFEQLTIFSTNLDPGDLVDDAFLRRIRHKIKIEAPSRPLFTEIFKMACEQRQIIFREEAVEYLYSNHYDRGRLPRSSDPRDLLEIVVAICRFRNIAVEVSQKLIADAAARFFYTG